MKIIHALGWYFPESCGGTEVYVDSLARGLTPLGIESVVAASRDGSGEDSYRHHGIQVYRYPVLPPSTLDEQCGQAPRQGFDRFARWLEEQKAQIYHQHSWTAGCGLHHLRWAKKLGLPAVLTVHLPGNVCLRDTMHLNGKTVCDGKVDVERCASCWAQHFGAPEWLAHAIGRIPAAASETLYRFLPESRLETLLGIPALVAQHKSSFLEQIDLADRVIAPCQWMYDALLLNGADAVKLLLSRQGVSQEFPNPPVRRTHSNGRLRVGFFGRWSTLKGIDILIAAMQRLPEAVPVDLDIHALAAGDYEKGLRQRALDSIKNDPRINIADAIPHDQIPAKLATYDLIAVPSICLETGPLAVLEALAAGVPVLGTNLGGIAEWIEHGKNGWLVPGGDSAALADALHYFADHPDLAGTLSRAILPMRTMDTVAAEMAAVYRALRKP